MKIIVLEEVFWRLKGTEGMFYFIEEDDKVKLYLPNNGYFVCSTHYREDGLTENEEASQAYLIWKEEHLGQGIPILEFKDDKVVVKVQDD